MEKNKDQETKDRRKGNTSAGIPWKSQATASDKQSWGDVEAELIAYVVRAVGGAGGSAQFTITQDGGALGIRVYHDGHKTKTVWLRLGEGLEEELMHIGDYYSKLSGEDVYRW